MKFGPVVLEEMSFKDMSYLELWQPLCSVERNHLCNFGRGYQEDQFCEIILNLDKWFSGRCHLKVGIMRNIHVKLNEISTSGLGGDVVYKKKIYGRTDARRTRDEDRSQ